MHSISIGRIRRKPRRFLLAAKIEHPTSNAQHPMTNSADGSRFGVRCWMFDVLVSASLCWVLSRIAIRCASRWRDGLPNAIRPACRSASAGRRYGRLKICATPAGTDSFRQTVDGVRQRASCGLVRFNGSTVQRSLQCYLSTSLRSAKIFPERGIYSASPSENPVPLHSPRCPG